MRGADSFLLKPLSPFRLDLTVWVLRRRPDNVVDRWDGHTYRRVVPLPAGPVEFAVTQIGRPESPQLRVSAKNHPLHSKIRSAVTVVLERLGPAHRPDKVLPICRAAKALK